MGRWLALLIGAWLTLSTAMAADAPPLVLSTGMREPWTTPDGTGFTDRVVPEMFRRIGRQATVVVAPASARAFDLANDGIDDGLAARVAGLEKTFPNLIAIPEPIFVNEFVACSLPPAPDVAAWDDLRPHSVAYVLGWKVFERNLPSVRELTTARDLPQLLGLLKRGRTEIVLHERWQALWQARQDGLTLAVAEPPLAREPMFIYLHRRHADLVAPLAKALVAMKADGSYQRLTEAAFAGLVRDR